MKVLPRVFLIVVLAVLLVGLYQITLDTKAWAALCCDNGMCWNQQCGATSSYLYDIESGPGLATPASNCVAYLFTCKDCIDLEPYSCQIAANCYCWDNGVKYKSALYYTPACDGRR